MMGLTVLFAMLAMLLTGLEVGSPGILIEFVYLWEEMKFYNGLSDDLQAVIQLLS